MRIRTHISTTMSTRKLVITQNRFSLFLFQTKQAKIVAVTKLMNKTNLSISYVELTKTMNVFTCIALLNSKSIDDAKRTSDNIKALITTTHSPANDSTSYISRQIAQTLTVLTNCECCIIRSPGENVISTLKCVINDDIFCFSFEL